MAEILTTTIATVEPVSFIKGDTVNWKKSLSCYPASNWNLSYAFRGASSLDKVAIADGDDFVITLSTSDTDNLTAGDYQWAAKVSKDSEVYTIATGQLVVRPDLTDVSNGYEARPHCKIMLDAIEAVLQGKASQDVLSYSIQGRSLTRMGVDELEKWRHQYRQEWRRYQAVEARKNGKRRGRLIKVRFNR